MLFILCFECFETFGKTFFIFLFVYFTSFSTLFVLYFTFHSCVCMQFLTDYFFQKIRNIRNMKRKYRLSLNTKPYSFKYLTCFELCFGCLIPLLCYATSETEKTRYETGFTLDTKHTPAEKP